MTSIQAQRYDLALRDWKKGKFVLDGMLGKQKGTSTVQEKRVYEKVWKSAEGIMSGMKKDLILLLKDPMRSVEDQEKTIT